MDICLTVQREKFFRIYEKKIAILSSNKLKKFKETIWNIPNFRCVHYSFRPKITTFSQNLTFI